MFLKVKGGKVQSSRQGRFGARSESGHQPNSPARLSSLLSEGAQHHCITDIIENSQCTAELFSFTVVLHVRLTVRGHHSVFGFVSAGVRRRA